MLSAAAAMKALSESSVPSSAGLSVADRHTLVAISAGTAALSLAGSSFIVLCYLLFKELHKFSFKLVFFLALSVLPLTCFAVSSLWSGTSLATTLIRSIGSDYGQQGAWCWTEPGRTGKKVAHLITFYGPLWGAILYNGFTYYQVNHTLNNATRMAVALSERPNQSDLRADRKAFNRWGYYPLILIGSWSFATINRAYDFINPNHRIFWLSFLDVGFAGLMGLFNSIAYGLNSSVRRAIAERIDLWVPEKFRRWLPAAKLRSSQETELTSLIVEGQR
ncbi:hypothetical protein ZIOFF_018491 [Zingiber officinale]|uniref:G-protein coupled receptor 1 n=1 Tax=Zingiber officinale TaxID=94328 RepID=A0A8J5H647_ZINOF|nr:hypothetical protein ZIOFF_018491 [Zingiber officinale]